MALLKKWTMLLPAGALLAAAACNGGASVPPTAAGGAPGSQLSSFDSNFASPQDNTSILKGLTKDVVIASTVDPTNGDSGPHSIAVASTSYGTLKKGYLTFCNFSDSSGNAGKGTTVDYVQPKPSSKAATFAQSSDIAGCAGDTVTTGNDVFAAGLTSKLLTQFGDTGKTIKTWNFKGPFSPVDASNKQLYAAEYIFTGDVKNGTITSFSINYYGNQKPLQVISGFAVNKKPGWSALGPTGLQYFPKKDTLYAVDGVDNTVVSFNHASELLVADEIVVQKGGKTFKCKYPKTTCGTLVYSGSPLNAPVAMAVLPNGNLVVANSAGGNTLVEIDTSTGKVLDTKVVDTSKTAGVFGLLATGTKDSNTVLYYTDANTNTLHELEP